MIGSKKLAKMFVKHSIVLENALGDVYVNQNEVCSQIYSRKQKHFLDILFFVHCARCKKACKHCGTIPAKQTSLHNLFRRDIFNS